MAKHGGGRLMISKHCIHSYLISICVCCFIVYSQVTFTDKSCHFKWLKSKLNTFLDTTGFKNLFKHLNITSRGGSEGFGVYLSVDLSSLLGIFPAAFLSPGWSPLCSPVDPVSALYAHTQQAAVRQLLAPPDWRTECWSQALGLWLCLWSRSATTAPAGSSSAPCPEVRSCSSSLAGTDLRSFRRERRSVCPRRAAAATAVGPNRLWARSCSLCGSMRRSATARAEHTEPTSSSCEGEEPGCKSAQGVQTSASNHDFDLSMFHIQPTIFASRSQTSVLSSGCTTQTINADTTVGGLSMDVNKRACGDTACEPDGNLPHPVNLRWCDANFNFIFSLFLVFLLPLKFQYSYYLYPPYFVIFMNVLCCCPVLCSIKLFKDKLYWKECK